MASPSRGFAAPHPSRFSALAGGLAFAALVACSTSVPKSVPCGDACTAATSCPTCALQLVRIGQNVGNDNLQQVVVAIDYQPDAAVLPPGVMSASAPDGGTPAPLPDGGVAPALTPVRVADLRIRVGRVSTLQAGLAGQSGPPKVTLASVTLSDLLVTAGKTLYVDPLSKQTFRQLANGDFQVLLVKPDDATPLPAGRWLTFTFTLNDPGPLSFEIVRRSVTLAPLGADVALQLTPYDGDLGFTASTD